MSKVNFSIRLEHARRVQYIKTEIKHKILKSVQVNKNIKKSKRFFSTMLLRGAKKIFKLARQHKVCLLRGRNRGVYKQFYLSRHAVKALNLEARMQNIKTISW